LVAGRDPIVPLRRAIRINHSPDPKNGCRQYPDQGKDQEYGDDVPNYHQQAFEYLTIIYLTQAANKKRKNGSYTRTLCRSHYHRMRDRDSGTLKEGRASFAKFRIFLIGAAALATEHSALSPQSMRIRCIEA
jgi:hypothetical protein